MRIRRLSSLMCLAATWVICSISADVAPAQTDAKTAPAAPRVLPIGTLPKDKRLSPPKNLNGHFPFKVPDTAGDWHVRSQQLKKRVLVANGLWPMPDKTPLNPVIHGKVNRPGFSVERVYFQSLPGHYVTGLLFRPEKKSDEARPGVLSPHGHGGRQQTHSDSELKRQLASGAEHYAGSGSMPKLARCAQLAKMGCVTFIFDMLGYADSVQIPRSVAHRHSDPRPEEQRNPNSKGWVFFSIDADLRLQSIMGLQTWNAIRALDFLASLPDVDPERLAVTGGSGGGTQSILLGAIDDRIKVSFPNGMVSTSMQGGCYCENCNLLRVGTGNVELAALFAPRPQAMTSADDWTRDMMTDGYPELQWLYAMIGNEEDVYCRPMLHFKHNYNYVTRMTMYQWMNKHLKLGLDVPVIETDYKPLTDAETKVWNDEHPLPKDVGPAHERSVCKWLDDSAKTKLEPVFAKSSREDAFQGALPIIFGLDYVPAVVGFPKNELTLDLIGEPSGDSLSVTPAVLRNERRGTSIPILTVATKRFSKADWNKVVVWTLGSGKSAAFDENGNPTKRLRQLASDATVILPDLFWQGEYLGPGQTADQPRLVAEKRSYSAFTYGYNKTLVGQRVCDLIDVVAHANTVPNADVRLLSDQNAASWALAASVFLSKKQLTRALVDANDFRFENVNSYRDANFVPGAVKYGDVDRLRGLIEADFKDADNEANLAWLIN